MFYGKWSFGELRGDGLNLSIFVTQDENPVDAETLYMRVRSIKDKGLDREERYGVVIVFERPTLSYYTSKDWAPLVGLMDLGRLKALATEPGDAGDAPTLLKIVG